MSLVLVGESGNRGEEVDYVLSIFIFAVCMKCFARPVVIASVLSDFDMKESRKKKKINNEAARKIYYHKMNNVKLFLGCRVPNRSITP